MNTSALTSPSGTSIPSVAPQASAVSTLSVFAGFRLVASGSRDEVTALLRARRDDAPALVFDDCTGERLDLDLNLDLELRPAAPVSAPEVTAEPAANPTSVEPSPLHPATPARAPARRVGRPRLGVVAREVTLLPRHWDWLNRQPGGASVALRKLVDEARRVQAGSDAVRAAREAAYRFMIAIAGDLPGFEEATRALFAGQQSRFESLLANWPGDLAAHARKLAAGGWSS